MCVCVGGWVGGWTKRLGAHSKKKASIGQTKGQMRHPTLPPVESEEELTNTQIRVTTVPALLCLGMGFLPFLWLRVM